MKTIKSIFFICFVLIGFMAACTDEVDQPLIPEFSSDVKEIVVGENIVFKDESLGEPSKWNWYFEGGTPASSILFSPTVKYEVPGTYSVRLVVVRGNDSVVVNKEDYVVVDYPSEIITDFTVDKTIGTNEDQFSFTDISEGYPTEWFWEFITQEGVVVTSTEQNPSLNFEPGIYSVKLTVKNPNISSSKTVSDYLTIIDKYSVAADFGAVSRNTYAGGSIQFQDKTSGNAAEWEWTFEGGTPSSSTEQNPLITYSSPGKYKVTLKSSNAVNTSTIEKEQFTVVIPSENLVMYLPFDGSSHDAGPHQLNPEILNKGIAEIKFDANSRFTGKNAEGYSAAQFMSVDANNYAVLSIPETDYLDFQTADFTVAFWVKLPQISKNAAIFHHGSGPGARPDNENRQSWFRFQPSGQFARFCVEQKGKAGNWVEYTEKRMDDNLWHHYVCIYKEEGGKKNGYMYIDGVLEASSLGKDIKTIDKTPYVIGANYRFTNGLFAPENFLSGYIDDYILYKRALSEEEAIKLYTY
ncbi:PKD domain-containing protein [Proteiniphilum sp. UBA7639]|uniref:PKD domain-containing protein n=1 Tax=Proteiniphilum sp. UBA7639 TaxID=1947289 RepID=UPI002579A08B|nr:PKD domain-containing protein [Proteiniphilum sp. UBA7639]